MSRKSRRYSASQVLCKIQTVCGWILTVFFSVIAIAMLWYSNLTGVVYLGFAIALCPAIQVPVHVQFVIIVLGLFLL
jgi:heme/copper-type cytochrome/quinol oxidase subunit 4